MIYEPIHFSITVETRHALSLLLNMRKGNMMNKKFMKMCWSLILIVAISSKLLAQSSEAKEILAATKINGGICLIVGANNLELAKGLAESSELYVQIIESDAKLAEKLAFEIATSPLRFKLSIRNATFQTDHYSSNLINLIIIKTESDTKKINFEELNRVLTPKGFFLTTTKVNPLPKDGSLLENEAIKKLAYQTVFQKGERKFEWAPADSLKWRADPRAHISIGFLGLAHGSGKFFYRELVEAKDAFPKSAAILFARDAYNGRVLWEIEEPIDSFNLWRPNAFMPENHTMAVDNDNQFFYISPDKKLICLDAETGKQKSVLVETNAQASVLNIHDNQYLIYANTVFSTKTHKKIFSFNGKHFAHQDKLFTLKGSDLTIYLLADGKIVLEKNLDWLDAKIIAKLNIQYLCDSIILTQGDRWVRPFSIFSINPTTGEKNWTLDLEGFFALPVKPAEPKGKFFAGVPNYTEYNGKIIVFTTVLDSFYRDHQEGYFTRIDSKTGKIEEQDYGYQGKLFGSNCNNGTKILGNYTYYWHNVWYNIKTGVRTYPYIVHPGCFLATTTHNGYAYNIPSRKGGAIQGITAIGPSDFIFDQKTGGELLVSNNKKPTIQDPTKETDWPMYRHDETRGNSVANTSIESNLKPAWVNIIGKESQSYGKMMDRRTGLTAANIAYNMAFVADIDSNCVVATDMASGKTVWQKAMNSRVDFAPSIYKGMCFVAGKDGWVYCLDAKTGDLLYQLLSAPQERYIGGQEKMESMWPTQTDVFIKNDIGYISNGFAANVHGGSRHIAFEASTGKKIWAQCVTEPDTLAGMPKPTTYTGIFTSIKGSDIINLNGYTLENKTGKITKGNKNLRFLRGDIDDLMAFGNSLGRINEDRAEDLFSDGTVRGRSLSFDDDFAVAFTFKPNGQAFINSGECRIIGYKAGKSTWSTDPIELLVDDIVLTPKYAFVVGHYLRVKGEPELWIMSREDGKILNKYPVNGIPSFGGMSLSEKKLLIATRDGKLICFENEK